MIRKIIKINEEKCTGCGLCINACREGALQLVGGKAKLISESYCDGLGYCLPECPTGAITMEERVAAPFDEEAGKEKMVAMQKNAPQALGCGCPGSQVKTIKREAEACNYQIDHIESDSNFAGSQLAQWPCQIQLVPVNAPYFKNAHILVAADCTAFAYGNIHKDFMANKVTLIGCPKLDNIDYAKKLTEILKVNNIQSITVLRMEVPCCSGLTHAVKQALINSGKMVPWQITTIGTHGNIIQA